MFSPIRRSSLYLALWRFDICRLQYAVCRRISAVPGSHHMGIKAGSIPYATAASPGCGVHCEGARLDGAAAKVKPQARRSTRSEEHTSELQSLMRISSTVLFLNTTTTYMTDHHIGTLA